MLRLQRHSGSESDRREILRGLGDAIRDAEFGTQEFSDARWLMLEYLDISPGLSAETRVNATLTFLYEIVRNGGGSVFARLDASRRLMDFSLSHTDHPAAWLYAMYAGLVAAGVSSDAVSLSGAGAARALRWMQGLTARGAYAALNTGNIDMAVLLLEKGTGQLVTQAVGFLQTEPFDTSDSAHADTLNQIQQLSVQLMSKSAVTKTMEVRERLDVYTELSALLKERSRVLQEDEAPTLGFLNSIFTLADVTTLAREAHSKIIYLAAIQDQGYALVVSGDTEPETRWLKNFNEPKVSQWVDDLRQGTDGTRPVDTSRRDIVEKIVSEISDALCQLPAGKLLVVPIGPVGRLPLQAALHSSGKRVVNVAANAKVYESAYRRSQQPMAKGVLAVADPWPCTNGERELPTLPSARREAEQLVSRYGGLSLTGSAATKATVIDQSSKPWLAVHLAVHGLADHLQPYRGRIFLCDGPDRSAEELTVSELRPQARLAVLASCWLAEFGQELPDEVQSFSTALIESGCCGVLSALWPVSDMVTEEFMKHFYNYWLGQGLAPAEALARSHVRVGKYFPGETAAWQLSGL